jgi:transcriptional regulator of acetoin/glycerol metabolism
MPGPLPAFKRFRTRALDAVEADYFRLLLHETGWDLDEAARRSGLSKNRVYHFIRKHRLTRG